MFLPYYTTKLRQIQRVKRKHITLRMKHFTDLKHTYKKRQSKRLPTKIIVHEKPAY